MPSGVRREEKEEKKGFSRDSTLALPLAFPLSSLAVVFSSRVGDEMGDALEPPPSPASFSPAMSPAIPSTLAFVFEGSPFLHFICDCG